MFYPAFTQYTEKHYVVLSTRKAGYYYGIQKNSCPG